MPLYREDERRVSRLPQGSRHPPGLRRRRRGFQPAMANHRRRESLGPLGTQGLRPLNKGVNGPASGGYGSTRRPPDCMRSRLAASYSQARSSHLRAAITSLRPSAASAGSIRYRSRGSTVRARASATKLVALSGRVDTSALAVRSANSRSVNAKPDCVLTIPTSRCSRLPGSEPKPKAAACRAQSTRTSFWTIHPKGVDCSPSSATVDWALTAERLGRSHQATGSRGLPPQTD